MKPIFRISKSAAGRLVLTVFGLGLLGGCGTFDPVVDTTRFYTLSPVVAAASSAKSDAPAVLVRVRSVAAHLDRKEIAVRRGDHEVAYASGDVWAESLDDGLARAVIEGLRARLGDRASIGRAPRGRAQPPPVLVEMDLLTCEGRAGSPGTALLAVDWRVVVGDSGQVVAAARFATEKSGWGSGDFGQLAALLAAGADDLATTLSAPITVAIEAR